MLRLAFLTAVFTGLLQITAAQVTINGSGLHPDSIVVTAGAFTKKVDNGSALYNGPEHADYHPMMSGSPFFQTIEWVNGSIYTNGLAYTNVPMKYDLVKDRLVVRHPNGHFKIELISENIDSFTLAGHTFRRLLRSQQQPVPGTGFYEMRYLPPLTLIIKRQNTVIEFIENTEIKRRVEERFQFFIIKDGAFHEIKRGKELLALMEPHKKEVRQHLRKNRIKLRKNNERAISEAVTFYHQLIQNN